jgi:hypothetical protein
MEGGLRKEVRRGGREMAIKLQIEGILAKLFDKKFQLPQGAAPARSQHAPEATLPAARLCETVA